MNGIEILFYVLAIVYIIPCIIVIIGYYVDFKGKTLQEFVETLHPHDRKKDYYGDDDATPLQLSLIPLVNIVFAIVFVSIGIIRLIKLPFKLVNKKYHIWDKLKNKKIK